jgi:multiple sugar transport system substrate-binding protein
MEEITFSYFDRGKDVPNNIGAIVGQFEHEHGIKVHLETIPWSMGWSRMVEVALYHSGPDVSEIGNTWAGDLTRMEAIRPFTSEEIISIAGDDDIFESVWGSVSRPADEPSAAYSIPWSADPRAIFYRRDWLGEAGIDEEKTFEDLDQFEQMLRTFKTKKLPIPIVLPTARTHLTIHNLASWIWCAGGSFLSPDNLNINFDQPESLKGIYDYFRLSQYLGAAASEMGDYEAYELFYKGKAAVTLGGYWVLHSTAMTSDVRDNMGIQPIPKYPFVGGNHLVIWNHTRREKAALKFIEFLHMENVGRLIYPQFGLPVHISTWRHPPFDAEHYQVLMKAIKNGRGFPAGQLWGLVEKRLTDIFADIWASILREPAEDPKELIESQVKGLANRLRLTLGSNPI